MILVQDVYDYVNQLAPFDTQEPWDNSGLLVGDGSSKVEKILCALDATNSVIHEAEEVGANLIVTHHPVIFNPLKKLYFEHPVYQAVQKGIHIICAHTCLDKADGGVNDCLVKALDLKNVRKCDDPLGLLRMGELDREYSLNEFLAYVGDKLNLEGIKYTPTEKNIKNVAVCGGSGAEFYESAFQMGADAYITADIKHNYFIEFRDMGLCVLDASHFCTENVVIKPLAEKLSNQFKEIEVLCSKVSKDPAYYWTK